MSLFEIVTEVATGAFILGAAVGHRFLPPRHTAPAAEELCRLYHALRIAVSDAAKDLPAGVDILEVPGMLRTRAEVAGFVGTRRDRAEGAVAERHRCADVVRGLIADADAESEAVRFGRLILLEMLREP